MNNLQIKICGITSPEQAVKCQELGVSAIGLVFFPKSPRNVELEDSRQICSALPKDYPKVAVTVNADFAFIKKIVDTGINIVQFHGQESSAFINMVKSELGVQTIKFAPPEDLNLEHLQRFNSPILVEAKHLGDIPGGTGKAWNWESAIALHKHLPLILAGGIGITNIAEAIAKAQPDAIDLSSSVEITPGVKDLKQVEKLIIYARELPLNYNCREVFPSN